MAPGSGRSETPPDQRSMSAGVLKNKNRRIIGVIIMLSQLRSVMIYLKNTHWKIEL